MKKTHYRRKVLQFHWFAADPNAFWRRDRKIIISVVLILVLTGFSYILFTHLFRLTEIRVIGDNVRIEVDRQKLTDNLLLLDTAAIRKQLLADNIQIGDIQITKSYPHTLVIAITFKSPIARIRTDKRIALIDSGGIVIATDTHADGILPLIDFNVQDVPDGTRITNPDVAAALALVGGVPAGFAIDEVITAESGVLRAVSGKTSILFEPNTPIGPMLSTLQTLMTGFRMKGTVPASIDLRFDKPVVQF
jgi:hypothetical protein